MVQKAPIATTDAQTTLEYLRIHHLDVSVAICIQGYFMIGDRKRN